jgi:molybdenum cofactor biosynthesis protein B
MSRIDESRPFHPVRIAVLAVSDTRSLSEDTSGAVLVERLTEAGHTLAARHILPDERDQIADQLRAWVADPGIDVIITTGGTGLTGRDVTVEAHRDVYEKEIEAFATAFTMVSMQKIGTSAVQSRATGGVANGTYIFALPGSSGACKDAWDEILKWQLDYRHRPVQFRRDPAPARRTSATEVTITRVSWHSVRLGRGICGTYLCVQPHSESVEPCDFSAAP